MSDLLVEIVLLNFTNSKKIWIWWDDKVCFIKKAIFT